MPLETATYINGLQIANPDHNDSLGVADSHLRLIKTTLKNTFPNVAGAVTLSDTQLNALSTAIARIGTLEGQANHLTGNQSLTGNFTIDSAHFLSAGAVFEGTNRLVPPGLIAMWSGSVASIPGGWHLCDGTSFTPDLRDRFVVGAGLTYTPGQTGGNDVVSGTTTWAGAHSHDGLTQPAGDHTHGAFTDVQGGHSHGGNTLGHALTVDEIPPHSHTYTLRGGPAQSVDGGEWVTGNGFNTRSTDSTGSGWNHTHGISTDGYHYHGVTVLGTAAHQHAIDWQGDHLHQVFFDIRPKYYALCYIMKQ